MFLINQEELTCVLEDCNKGLHLWFDNNEIKQYCSDSISVKELDLKHCANILETFMECSTIQSKRAFFAILTEEEKSFIVKSYLMMAEQSVKARVIH